MELEKWETHDAQVISWVDPDRVLNLRPYKTAKEKRICHQENSARWFQLEFQISDYTQRDKSIQN